MKNTNKIIYIQLKEYSMSDSDKVLLSMIRCQRLEAEGADCRIMIL